MAFDWNFRELMPKRLADAYARQNGDYSSLLTQNMDNRQAGNADDMAQWMQQGNDYKANQQEQAALAQQQQEQAAAQKQSQIQSIQNQIAELEQRITANKAKLKDWGGVENQIAAIEARKINKQDPTSVWRWKVDKEDSRRIAAAEKQKGIDQAQANAQFEITNSLSAIRPNAGMDSNTKQRYLDQLANLRTLAQKNKLPTTAIDAKIAEVEGDMKPGQEQTSREQAKTDWKGLKGKPGLKSSEIQAALDDKNMNWDPDERKEAENLRDKLKKHEAAAQDVKDMKAWVKNTYGKDWSTLSTRIQETYQRIWKKRKGK